jgi:hypothetical protein
VILDAGAELGAGEDQIKDLENWDGPDEDDDHDKDGMDGVE